jgi:hypothetical protein
MTQPGTYNITLYQGATYQQQFTWKDQNNNPINLTGYTARMQIRESHDAASPFVTLSTGSGITLGGVAGTITLTISDSQTSAMTQSSGVYDIELVSSLGTVTRLLEGNVIISREVTR